MAKDFIGFALVRSFGGDVRAIGITSEKRGMTYGRYLHDDRVAHWGRHAIIYRYPEGTPQEFAAAAQDRVQQERDRHTAGIEEARRSLSAREQHRDRCVLEAAKGVGLKPKICPDCNQAIRPNAGWGDTGCGCVAF